jgi:hypothetical protein
MQVKPIQDAFDPLPARQWSCPGEAGFARFWLAPMSAMAMDLPGDSELAHLLKAAL